jgi:hypothetical protein
MTHSTCFQLVFDSPQQATHCFGYKKTKADLFQKEKEKKKKKSIKREKEIRYFFFFFFFFFFVLLLLFLPILFT